MANFEQFCRNKKLSSNLFFLKTAHIIGSASWLNPGLNVKNFQYHISSWSGLIWGSFSTHIQHYSKLRKNVPVSSSQNVPLSCLSQPLADWLAEAAYRDILGLRCARAYSAEWNTADRVSTHRQI